MGVAVRRASMKNLKVIVAINEDGEALVFRGAGKAPVGGILVLLPELGLQLWDAHGRQRRGKD